MKKKAKVTEDEIVARAAKKGFKVGRTTVSSILHGRAKDPHLSRLHGTCAGIPGASMKRLVDEV